MRRRPASQLLLAFATLVATAAPVVAAGLPACCKPAASGMKAGCCAKGAPCCKMPEAPKPDAAAKHAAPSLAVAPPPAFAAPSAVLAAAIPVLTTVRTAQRDHRAPTPDDSPPDRLARLHVLLI